MKGRASRTWPLLLSILALISFVILAEAVRRGATIRWDTAVTALVHESAGPKLTAFAMTVSFIGRLVVLIPATVVIVVGLLLARRRSAALALGLAMGGGLLLNGLIKIAVHRVRPHPFFGVEPESFSFPSGHVLLASCFCGAILLILNGRRKRSPLGFVFGAALVLAIGWSRIYLGVHYASDAAAGFLVAVSWLAALFGFGLFGWDNGGASR